MSKWGTKKSCSSGVRLSKPLARFVDVFDYCATRDASISSVRQLSNKKRSPKSNNFRGFSFYINPAISTAFQPIIFGEKYASQARLTHQNSWPPYRPAGRCVTGASLAAPALVGSTLPCLPPQSEPSSQNARALPRPRPILLAH